MISFTDLTGCHWSATTILPHIVFPGKGVTKQQLTFAASRCTIWGGETQMANEHGLKMLTVRLGIASPDGVNRAVALLRQGELVAFPTDTVYGIGAHAFLEEAVARLYRAKGRPADQPIPLLLADAAAIEWVCTDIPPLAWQLAARFWPGALSLVLARSEAVPDRVTARGPTVAVRVPDDPVALAICRELGAPLAATSANLHGQPSPVTADEVEAALAGHLALILDGGRCRGGVASTVLDLTVSPPAILRRGPITAEQLARFLPET
jgi:L-threonylcarbamoyladenylate synthase